VDQGWANEIAACGPNVAGHSILQWPVKAFWKYCYLQIWIFPASKY